MRKSLDAPWKKRGTSDNATCQEEGTRQIWQMCLPTEPNEGDVNDAGNSQEVRTDHGSRRTTAHSTNTHSQDKKPVQWGLTKPFDDS